jgi:hypothetical protein
MKNERELTIDMLQHLANWAKKESESLREKLLGMKADFHSMEFRTTIQLLLASRGFRLVVVKYAKEMFGVDLSENVTPIQPRGIAEVPDFQEPSWFIGCLGDFNRMQALLDYQKHFASKSCVRRIGECSHPEIPET